MGEDRRRAPAMTADAAASHASASHAPASHVRAGEAPASHVRAGEAPARAREPEAPVAPLRLAASPSPAGIPAGPSAPSPAGPAPQRRRFGLPDLASALPSLPAVVRAPFAALGEAAGVVQQEARTGLAALLCPGGVRGAALECAWVAAHVALYPWGVARERQEAALGPFGRRVSLATLPPAQRGLVVSDVEAAGTPILLVHGMIDNRSIFTLLRRGLHRRGFGRVVTMNYGPLSGDVREIARVLAEEVEALCAETGYERIHVVGHSLGGLVARYYVQRLGGDERVHTLVTLGTPHAGTAHAYLLPHSLVRQLRPGSDLLRELAAPVPGCRTRMLAVWSDLDQMVVPQRHGRVEHPDLRVRNVLVRGAGHMSLPIDGRVVHEVSSTLAHLDSDGATVTPGVSVLRRHDQ